MRVKQPFLLSFVLCTLVLAGCESARESASRPQRPALDYSWVATTPRAELAGYYDRANVFMAADYYRRQAGYASGEIPPILLSDAYTSHPLAYYTLKREPEARTPSEANAAPAENSAARHFARGLTYYDLGDFDGAIQEFPVPFSSTDGMRAPTPFGRSPMDTPATLQRRKQTCKAQFA